MLTITPINNNSNKNQSNQSFGMNYDRSFRTALKSFAPYFTETEDAFILAKKAIENLSQLKKRKDGLKLGTTGHPLETISDSIEYMFAKKGLLKIDGTIYEKFQKWNNKFKSNTVDDYRSSSSKQLLDVSEYLKTDVFLDNVKTNIKPAIKAPKDDSCGPLFEDIDDVVTLTRWRLGLFDEYDLFSDEPKAQLKRCADFRKFVDKKL